MIDAKVSRFSVFAVLVMSLVLSGCSSVSSNKNDISQTTAASKLAHGEVCAVELSNSETEGLEEYDRKCSSGYCYPGPSSAGEKTRWFCMRHDYNCAAPGEDGGIYGHHRSWENQGKLYIFRCLDPVSGARARYELEAITDP